MAISVTKRLFTVTEYYQMAQAGIFSEDDRVELLEGEIFEMSPISSRHAGCVKRLNDLLVRKLSGRFVIGVQDPIRLSEYSEPQPDITILKFRADFYSAEHPKPEDVLLLIEVCETSSEFDRRVKLPLYAKSGIPEVWLIDLTQGQIEVYRAPTEQGYSSLQTLRRGQTVTAGLLPLELTVEEIIS